MTHYDGEEDPLSAAHRAQPVTKPAPVTDEELAEWEDKASFWDRADISMLSPFLRLIAALRQERAKVADYEARLEIDHAYQMDDSAPDGSRRVEVPPGERSSWPDGIMARDETIKGLERNEATLRARIAELEGALREIDSSGLHSVVDHTDTGASMSKVITYIRARARNALAHAPGREGR